MLKNSSPRVHAILQALLVTLLWSSSWVLIKIGLEGIPALTFAGLRYSLAFLCLLPWALRPVYLTPLRGLSRRGWARLIVLGILFYAITQGTQFLGLDYLPAATVSLMLSFTTVIVALLGIVLLAERPTVLQWVGVGLYVVGVLMYFYPALVPAGQVFGLVTVTVGVLANAASSLLGRSINREGDVPPLVVTVASMGIGAIILLVAGTLIQGLPRLDLIHWAIIIWLAVVNTAFAFTLWNHTLRTLSAMESSIINNTMLIQIAVLAWIFLGEGLTWQEMVGMSLAGLGTLVVQLRRPENA